MSRLLIFVAVLTLSCHAIFAQEQFGIRTSNYAGVNGLTLNPASSLTNPLPWDANLLEFSQFFENNYLFIENYRLIDVMNLNTDYALRADLTKQELPTPPDKLIVDFYRSNGNKFHGSVATSVMGPGLMLKIGDASTVGFYTRARFAFNANKVPGSLGYYEYTDQPFEDAIEVDPFRLNAMAWSEIGLNYARSAETEYGEVSVGGTLKLLQGYEAGYAGLDQSMSFKQVRGNKLVGEPGSASYAFASSVTEDTVWQLRKHGAGVAVDLGFVYTIVDDYDGYRWKFGASLLDIGATRFNKAAEKHIIVVGDSVSIDLNDFENFKGPEEIDSIIQTFSQQLLKDPNASLESRAFGIWQPAALSLQLEYAITPFLFLNTSIVQGIPFTKNMVRRNSVAAFTPRFESRWFEVAFPMTVLDWRQLRSGAAMRVAFFWIGTEDLGSIFKRQNFDSTDIYFAIKVNPFQLNFTDSQPTRGSNRVKQKKIRAQSRKGVICPRF